MRQLGRDAYELPQLQVEDFEPPPAAPAAFEQPDAGSAEPERGVAVIWPPAGAAS